ncbi:hypothetical protein [Echinicola rosea]|nr:hypothetical protein [Echinicola rosea]
MRKFFVLSVLVLGMFSCQEDEEVNPVGEEKDDEKEQKIIYKNRGLSSEYSDIIAFDFSETSIYPGSILKLSAIREGKAIEISDYSKVKVPVVGDLFIKGISTVTEIIPSYYNFFEFHTGLVEGKRPIDDNFSTFYYQAIPIYSKGHFKYILDNYKGDRFDEALETINFDKKDLKSRGVLYAKRDNYNYAMSVPEDGIYVEEDLHSDELSGLDAAVISSVDFGRLDIILYESEYPHYLIHDIMGTAMTGEELSDEEINVLAGIKIICYSIRNEPGVKKYYEGMGDADFLEDFYLGKGDYMEDGDGTILGFSVRDLKDHTSIIFEKEVTYEEPVALED